MIARYRWLRYFWLTALYLGGAFLWGQFFNWGSIPFDFHDWAEVTAARLAFLQDAVLKGVFPLHMPDSSALRGVTDRYWVIPDMLFTPQLLLFKFLDVGQFVLAHIWLMYTIGFAGTLWFFRKYHLSLPVFTAAFLLFNFNGQIVSHLTIGHLTWGGYYLFPWFLALLIRLQETDEGWGWAGKMALLLLLCFLQGSFHHYVWLFLFLGMFSLVFWKRFLTILKALVFSGLLSAFRILPPLLGLGRFDNEFIGGYPAGFSIIDAMVNERSLEMGLPFKNFISALGWWEFDLYVGWAGFVFIIIGVTFWLIHQYQTRRISPFFVPMCIMTLMSFGGIYRLVTLLPIPILNGERVSSRMILVPFTFAVFLAAIYIQKYLNGKKISQIARIVGFGALLLLGWDVIRHTLEWRVVHAFSYFPFTPVNLSIKVVANHPDSTYTSMLIGGAAISLISLVVMAGFIFRNRRLRLPHSSQDSG